ncbi:MAG TPA: hypothetical protein PKX87_02475 [Alphaproteobacteria bacterium]|nr:hypothetical protein [Alphaproteobacteria bacterium]
MRPEFEPNRFITLMGDPIGAQGPKPLLLSLPKRTEVQVAVGALGLTALFNHFAVQATELLTEAQAEQGALETVVMTNTIVVPFVRYFERKLLLPRSGFSESDLAEKCVDTRPDQTTLPSTQKYGFKALSMKYRYGGWLGVIALVQTPFTIMDLAAGENPALHLAARSGELTRLLSGYRRFNKIAKGEWMIVDMPEPEKVPDRNPVLRPAELAA